MSHQNHGLFDTPASRREIRFATAVIAALSGVFLLTLRESGVRVGEVDAFVPVIDAVVSLGELIIATILYAQAAIFRSRALTLLATGFVLGPLLLIGHGLTFPGAFSPDGLFGAGLSTAAWLMIFRRLEFPLVIIGYTVIKWSEWLIEPEARPPGTNVPAWITAAVIVAIATMYVAIHGDGLLPSMFVNNAEANVANLWVFNLLNIAVVIIAMIILLLKRPSVLDVWLLISLAGWLIQSVLNLPLESRFTVGWYSLFVIVLITHLFVLLALIGESSRLYARLVLSTAARNRERDARMMTMDAVAASISHEVGQPLAAISLGATAGMQNLAQTPPDYQAASRSLRDIAEAATRTFDVLKSVRSTYGRGAGSLSEFELNELVLEAASLLSREFSAERISLQLMLDRDLPPIMANRVQIQRVAVNLLTNAIESIDAAGRRARRITIRSSKPDSENVLLEISDTGGGISSENLDRIFDPFFTTKPTGTGLGLTLCSTIVEEHGGRLWATSRDLGATFHLRLRRKPKPEEAHLRIA